MKTLLVVADLGGFKAYKLENNHHFPQSPRLELLEQFNNAEAHGRIVDKVSDSSGRFPRATGARGINAMSDGERHNIELESRKRFIRQLAQRLNALARSQEMDRCFSRCQPGNQPPPASGTRSTSPGEGRQKCSRRSDQDWQG